MRIISTILGLLSLIYFVFYALGAGLSNKFTYFWLILGVLLVGIAIGLNPIKRMFLVIPFLLKWIIGVVFALCMLALIVAEVRIISYGAKNPTPGADYVIVLGTQIKGNRPSYNLATRLNKACEYLKENPDTLVIVSGGQGADEITSEADVMANYLMEKGIAKERIILEDKSRDTYENIKFSREKMKEDASVVIVTNRFHVFRGVGIAKKQGLTNVEGLGSSVLWYTAPNMYVREAFAVLQYTILKRI